MMKNDVNEVQIVELGIENNTSRHTLSILNLDARVPESEDSEIRNHEGYEGMVYDNHLAVRVCRDEGIPTTLIQSIPGTGRGTAAVFRSLVGESLMSQMPEHGVKSVDFESQDIQHILNKLAEYVEESGAPEFCVCIIDGEYNEENGDYDKPKAYERVKYVLRRDFEEHEAA